MKKLLPLFLSLALLSSQGMAQGFESPDILIDTKLKADWSGLLISNIRTLLKNKGRSDPFKKKFPAPKTVFKSEVDKFLTPSSRELLDELGKLLEMDFLKGQAKVVVHGLGYNVTNFRTDLKLKAEDPTKDEVTMTSDFFASKVKVEADKIVVSLVIPGKNPLPAIEIEVMKPVFVAAREDLINFSTIIKIITKPEKFNLELQQLTFENLARELNKDASGITFDFESVVVPKVSVKIGNKVINFDQKKIEKLIFSKKDGIKGLLLAEFSNMLAQGLFADAFKLMDKLGFERDYWFDSSTIQSFVRVNSFHGFSNNEHVLTQLDGDFCVPQTYVELREECLNRRITQIPKSRIKESEHKESLEIMRKLVEGGETNIVASVSEDYINKVLATSLDAGLWDEKLKEAGVRMGPNRPFLMLEDKGSRAGTLYMDMIYTPSKVEQIALGTREVRFPLVLKVGVKIVKEDVGPLFIIHVFEVDTSDKTLMYGRPDIGVISNVQRLRLKHKVLAKIREDVASLNNKDIVSLSYPTFKGLNLEKVEFVSDGLGRMNALLKMHESEFEIE